MNLEDELCDDPACGACRLLSAVQHLKDAGMSDEVVVEMFGDVMGMVFEETVH
jgi:hypothetical protein